MFPANPPRLRKRDRRGRFLPNPPAPTFHRFPELPYELKVYVLEASLESIRPLIDPDIPVPMRSAGSMQPEGNHHPRAQAKFLKHARNLSQVDKWFREEVARRFLVNIKVVFTYLPRPSTIDSGISFTYRAGERIFTHLQWSLKLRHLGGPGATSPPGSVQARQFCRPPRLPGLTNPLVTFSNIITGTHQSRIRPDQLEFPVELGFERQKWALITHGRFNYNIYHWEPVWEHYGGEISPFSRTMPVACQEAVSRSDFRNTLALNFPAMAYVNLKIVEIRWACDGGYDPCRRKRTMSRSDVAHMFLLTLWQATAYPNLRELTVDFVEARYLQTLYTTSADLITSSDLEKGGPIFVAGQDRIQRLVIRGLSQLHLSILLPRLEPYVTAGGFIGTTTSQFALLTQRWGRSYEFQPVPPTPIQWRVKPVIAPTENTGTDWKGRYGEIVKDLTSSVTRSGRSVKFLEDRSSQLRADKFPHVPFEWEYGYIPPNSSRP